MVEHKDIFKELYTKYPNLKIYSVQKILREHISHYKKISEPIEKVPKFKSMKANQIYIPYDLTSCCGIVID